MIPPIFWCFLINLFYLAITSHIVPGLEEVCSGIHCCTALIADIIRLLSLICFELVHIILLLLLFSFLILEENAMLVNDHFLQIHLTVDL